MFSEKDTKFDKTLHRRFDKYVFSKYQIDGEDFVNFCGLLRKHELYFAFTRPFLDIMVKAKEKRKKVGIGVHDFLRICVTKFCVISKVGTKVSLKMDMATFVHIMNEAEQ